MLPPIVERLHVDTQRKMSWSSRTMMRKLVARACRLRIEREQNIGIAHTKENVAIRFSRNHGQTKYSLIEIFSGVEVIDVDRSFDDGQHFHFILPSSTWLPLDLGHLANQIADLVAVEFSNGSNAVDILE